MMRTLKLRTMISRLTSWPAKSSPIEFQRNTHWRSTHTSPNTMAQKMGFFQGTLEPISTKRKRQFCGTELSSSNRNFFFECCLILMPTRRQIFPLCIVNMIAPPLLLSTNGGRIIILQLKFLGTLFWPRPLTSLFLCRKMTQKRQKLCTQRNSCLQEVL